MCSVVTVELRTPVRGVRGTQRRRTLQAHVQTASCLSFPREHRGRGHHQAQKHSRDEIEVRNTIRCVRSLTKDDHKLE